MQGTSWKNNKILDTPQLRRPLPPPRFPRRHRRHSCHTSFRPPWPSPATGPCACAGGARGSGTGGHGGLVPPAGTRWPAWPRRGSVAPTRCMPSAGRRRRRRRRGRRRRSAGPRFILVEQARLSGRAKRVGWIDGLDGPDGSPLSDGSNAPTPDGLSLRPPLSPPVPKEPAKAPFDGDTWRRSLRRAGPMRGPGGLESTPSGESDGATNTDRPGPATRKEGVIRFLARTTRRHGTELGRDPVTARGMSGASAE
jgi:hypothetical protein